MHKFDGCLIHAMPLESLRYAHIFSAMAWGWLNVKKQPKQTPRHSREGGNPEDVQEMTKVSQPPLDSRLRGNECAREGATLAQ